MRLAKSHLFEQISTFFAGARGDALIFHSTGDPDQALKCAAARPQAVALATSDS
jgi:hypothetical protein